MNLNFLYLVKQYFYRKETKKPKRSESRNVFVLIKTTSNQMPHPKKITK